MARSISVSGSFLIEELQLGLGMPVETEICDPSQPLRIPVRHHGVDPSKLDGSQVGVVQPHPLQARHDGCDQHLGRDRAQIVGWKEESSDVVM